MRFKTQNGSLFTPYVTEKNIWGLLGEEKAAKYPNMSKNIHSV